VSAYPQHRTARIAIGAALATGALLLAGCGGGSSGTPASGDSMSSMSMGSSPTSRSTGGTTSGSTATVTIKDFAFDGPPSVAPGTRVTVTNEDSEAHTLTADGAGGFDVKIDPGASATFTAPMKPGSYPYHCTYHSNMHGTLAVR
jgi:plastocyanin